MTSSTELANLPQLGALPQQPPQQNYSALYSSPPTIDAAGRIFDNSFSSQEAVPKRKHTDDFDLEELMAAKKLKSENFLSENSDDFSFNSQTLSPWSDHSTTERSNCFSSGVSPSFIAIANSVHPSPNNVIDGVRYDGMANGGLSVHSDSSEAPSDLSLGHTQSNWRPSIHGNISRKQNGCPNAPSTLPSPSNVLDNAVHYSLLNNQEPLSSKIKSTIESSGLLSGSLTHNTKHNIEDRENQVHLRKCLNKLASMENSSKDGGGVSTPQLSTTSSEAKLHRNAQKLQVLEKLRGKKRVVVGNFYKAIPNDPSNAASSTQPMKFMYWVYVTGESFNLADYIKSVTFTLNESCAQNKSISLKSPFEIIGPSSKEFQLTLQLNPFKRKVNKPSRVRYIIKLGNCMDPHAYSGQWRIGHETLYTVSLVDLPKKSSTPPQRSPQLPIFSPAFLPPTSCVPDTDHLVIPFYSSMKDNSEVPPHLDGVPVVSIQVPLIRNFNGENASQPAEKPGAHSPDLAALVTNRIDDAFHQVTASLTASNDQSIEPNKVAEGNSCSTQGKSYQVSSIGSEPLRYPMPTTGFSDAVNPSLSEPGDSANANLTAKEFSRGVIASSVKLNGNLASGHDVPLSSPEHKLSQIPNHEKLDSAPLLPSYFELEASEDMQQDAPWSNFDPNDRNRIPGVSGELTESVNNTSPRDQPVLNTSFNATDFNFETDSLSSAIEFDEKEFFEFLRDLDFKKTDDIRTSGRNQTSDGRSEPVLSDSAIGVGNTTLDELIKDVESRSLSSTETDNPPLYVPTNFLDHSPVKANRFSVDKSEGVMSVDSSAVGCQGITGEIISELLNPLVEHPWDPVEKKLSLGCNGKRRLHDTTDESQKINCTSKKIRSSEESTTQSAKSPRFVASEKQQATCESVTPAVLASLNCNQTITFGDVLEKLKTEEMKNAMLPHPGSMNLASTQIVNGIRNGGGSLCKDSSTSSTSNTTGLPAVGLATQTKSSCPADDSDDEIQILSVVKKAPSVRTSILQPQLVDQSSLASRPTISLNALNKPEVIRPIRAASAATRVSSKPGANLLRCFNQSRKKMVKLGQEDDPAVLQLLASLTKGNVNILRSEQVFRPAQPIHITTTNSAAGKAPTANLTRLVSTDASQMRPTISTSLASLGMRVPTSNVIIQTSSAAVKNFSFKSYSNVKSLPLTVTPASIPVMSVSKNVSAPQTLPTKPPIKNITVKTNGKDFTFPVVQGKNFINPNVKTQIPLFKINSENKQVKVSQVEKLTPVTQVVSTHLTVTNKPIITFSVSEQLTNSVSVPCSFPSVVSTFTSPASSTLANSNATLGSCRTSSSQGPVSGSVVPSLGSLSSAVKSVQVCPPNSAVSIRGMVSSAAKPAQIPRAIASVSEYPTSSIPASLKTGNLISSVTVLPRRTVARPTGQNGKFNLISVSNIQNLPVGTKIQLDPVSTDALLTSTGNQRSMSTSSRININKIKPVQTLQPIKIDVSKSEPETFCCESTCDVVSSDDIVGRDVETSHTVDGAANVDVNNVSGDAGGASQACVASCSSLPPTHCVVSSKDFISPTATAALTIARQPLDCPPLVPVNFSPACAITHEPEFLNDSTTSCDVIVNESSAILRNGNCSHPTLSCVSSQKCTLSAEQSLPLYSADCSSIKEINTDSSCVFLRDNNDVRSKNKPYVAEKLSLSASALYKGETSKNFEKSENINRVGSNVFPKSCDSDRRGVVKGNCEPCVEVKNNEPVVMRSSCQISTDLIATKNVIYVNSGEKSVKFAQVLDENYTSKSSEIKDLSKMVLKNADLKMNLLAKLDGLGKKIVLSRPALGSPLILNGRKLYRIMPVSEVPSLASLKKIPSNSIISSVENTPFVSKEKKFITHNSSSVQLVASQLGRLRKGESALSSQQLSAASENKFGKSGVCAAVNSFLQTRDYKSELLNCSTLSTVSASSTKIPNNGLMQCDEKDPDLDSLTQEELANLSKYRRDKLEDQKREKLLKNVPLLQSACGIDHDRCNPSMFIRLAVRAFPLFRPDTDSYAPSSVLTGGENEIKPSKSQYEMSQGKPNKSFSKSIMKNSPEVSISSINIKEEIIDDEYETVDDNFADHTKIEGNARLKKTCHSVPANLKTDVSKNMSESARRSSNSGIDVLAPQLVLHLVKDSRQQFLRHNLMKQRSLEYQRARAVLRYMRQWCEPCASLWSLRAVVAWARQHGHTPCPFRPSFLKSDWYIPEARLGYLYRYRRLQHKEAVTEVPECLRPGNLQALCEKVFSEGPTRTLGHHANDEARIDVAEAVEPKCSPSPLVLAWDQIVASKSSNMALSASDDTSAVLSKNQIAPKTPIRGTAAIVDSSSPAQVSIKTECQDNDDGLNLAGPLPYVSSLWDTFSDLVIGGHSNQSKNLNNRVHNNLDSRDLSPKEFTDNCVKKSDPDAPSDLNRIASVSSSGKLPSKKNSVEAPLSLDAACAEVRSLLGPMQGRLASHSELLPSACDCNAAVGRKSPVLADTSGLVLFKCLNLFLEDLLRSSLAVSWTSKCKSRPIQSETVSDIRKNAHQPNAVSERKSDSFSLNNSVSDAVASKCKSSTSGIKARAKPILESRVSSTSKKAGKNGCLVDKQSRSVSECRGNVSQPISSCKKRDGNCTKQCSRNFKHGKIASSALFRNHRKEVRTKLNLENCSSKSIVGNRRGRLSSVQRSSTRNPRQISSGDSMVLNDTEFSKNRGFSRKAQDKNIPTKNHVRPTSSSVTKNKHSSCTARAKVMTQSTNLLKTRMMNSMRGAPTKALRRKLTAGYHLPGILNDEDRRHLPSCGPVKEITAKHVLRALLYTRPQFKIIGSKVLSDLCKK